MDYVNISGKNSSNNALSVHVFNLSNLLKRRSIYILGIGMHYMYGSEVPTSNLFC